MAGFARLFCPARDQKNFNPSLCLRSGMGISSFAVHEVLVILEAKGPE